jgi:RNA polymerase sigma-70 factor (ECF subfamily)
VHLTHNATAADDLVQETIVRGIENIHLWRQGTDLRARLFTILHNRYVSDVRRAARYSTLVRSTCVGRSAAYSSRQVERLQLRDLEGALARLPEAQRSVVLLIGLEAQPYETLAACLGIPVGTVRSRLFRGRLRLRQLTDGAPLPQQPQSRPSGPTKLSGGLIRRDQRSPAGRAGRVGDQGRLTPRL